MRAVQLVRVNITSMELVLKEHNSTEGLFIHDVKAVVARVSVTDDPAPLKATLQQVYISSKGWI